MNFARMASRGGPSQMSHQKRGLDYEHELSNEIYEATNGDLFPLRVGYSGNQLVPAPDILLDDGVKVHAMELKRTTTDRISVTHDADGDVDDDLSGLLRFADDYPRTVAPYVGVRFTNRQLALLKLWPSSPSEALRTAAGGTPLDARVTNSGNLSIHRPATESQGDSDGHVWPSATKGDDVEHVLDVIGYDRQR